VKEEQYLQHIMLLKVEPLVNQKSAQTRKQVKNLEGVNRQVKDT
jgi:hypothetical protein